MIVLRNLILIAANPFRDTDYQTSRAIYTMLSQAGHSCSICPVFSDDLTGLMNRKKIISTISNFIEQGRRFHVMFSIAAGEYTLSRRMMLDVELIRNGEAIFRQSVLNDVVVHGANAECIGILAKCNDLPMTHFSGDGIIVATPTGSTAYSMSAGGPIVEPNNENIIVTPICPHTMAAKSYVLLPTRTVLIEPERIHDRRAILSADGNEAIPLISGDQIRVKRSERSVLLAETGTTSFFDRAFEKLSGYREG